MSTLYAFGVADCEFFCVFLHEGTCWAILGGGLIKHKIQENSLTHK